MALNGHRSHIPRVRFPSPCESRGCSARRTRAHYSYESRKGVARELLFECLLQWSFPVVLCSGQAFFPFGSRFCCKSSGARIDSIPLVGTSPFAIQTIAFKTTFRRLSSAQFLCVWPPVK